MWDKLIIKLSKFLVNTQNGYVKRVHHDQIVPLDLYRSVYSQIKLKYNKWVEIWPEKTDAVKFVYEDIGIASFLLALWQQPV